MDEDDFVGRPKSKQSWRTTIWSPKLEEQVWYEVLTYVKGDFMLKETIARNLSAKAHEVGMILEILAEAGVVFGPVPVPPKNTKSEDNIVNLCGTNYRFSDGRWRKCGFGTFKVESKPTRKMLKRMRYGRWYKSFGKWVRSIPDVFQQEEPPDWKGDAYYILRETKEFKDACLSRGLPADPLYKPPWKCVNCGHEGNKPDQDRCDGCREYLGHPDIAARREAERKKHSIEEPTPPPECPRCSGPMKYKSRNGKKVLDHSLRVCNVQLCRHILDA